MKNDIANFELNGSVAAAIPAGALLHHARYFARRSGVVSAPDISADEKRAILASWASDLYALESKPAMRVVPGMPEPIPYEEVVTALKSLDEAHQA